MQTKQKWSDLVNRVQNAGQQQRNFVNFQQRYRMQALKSQLLDQIGQKKQFLKQRDITKHQQREEIEHLVQQQKQKKIQQREKKKHLELMYQTKNHDLMLTPKNKQQNYNNSSPFDKLIQNCTNRQMSLKDKFKMQNKINNIQAEVNKKKKRSAQEQQKQSSQTFINHVEQQYIKRLTERQRFKQKYLKNGFNQKTSNTQTERNLLKNYYKQKQQEIDETMQHLNSKVQNSFNSPAYLGKSALSFDRKVQLSLIDKQLGLNNEYYKSKIRMHSQAKQPQLNHDAYDKNSSLSGNTGKKINTQSPQSFKIDKINMRSALNSYGKGATSNLQFDKERIHINLANKKVEKPKHAYIQYNIISGSTRQFFA